MKNSTKQILGISLFFIIFMSLICNCNIREGASNKKSKEEASNKKSKKDNNKSQYQLCENIADNQPDTCINNRTRAGYQCKYIRESQDPNVPGRGKCADNDM